MSLMYLPTLSEMREMLGEELYVKFVWMWREQEQDVRAAERRARYAAVTPQREVETWPTPVFVRSEERVTPMPAPAFQTALLRGIRSGDAIEVGDLAGLLEHVGAREAPREAAMAGRRRRR